MPQVKWLIMGLVAVVLLIGVWRYGPRIIDRLRPTPTALDAELVDKLTADIERGRYGVVDSLLIWHQDELVMEAYFNGYDRDRLHPVYSVTKSMTSAAFGIARGDGHLADLQAPIYTYFPELEPAIGQDAITVEHLLTMTGGYEWDEISSDFQRNEQNSAYMLTESPDWLAHMFGLPLAQVPGEQFVYNSGSSLLLGEMIAREVDQPLDTFVDSRLFTPLEIDDWRWESGPNGVTSAGWGLQMRPVDMLKIGRLYLNGGRWNEEQIIPADWVAESTRKHVDVSDVFSYGYQWWQFPDQRSTTRHLTVNDVYLATGYAGQYIVVVPHLDLVVVSTGNNPGGAVGIFKALESQVFPAAEGENK